MAWLPTVAPLFAIGLGLLVNLLAIDVATNVFLAVLALVLRLGACFHLDVGAFCADLGRFRGRSRWFLRGETGSSPRDEVALLRGAAMVRSALRRGLWLCDRSQELGETVAGEASEATRGTHDRCLQWFLTRRHHIYIFCILLYNIFQ